jgi:glutamate/tyrosine decarboxylase-like PLP-dependent enzyme
VEAKEPAKSDRSSRQTEKMKNQRNRFAPLEISSDEFRTLGYLMVDRIADFLASLPERPVTPGESPKTVREALDARSVPEQGIQPQRLLEETADLLFNHSLFNGHPRFWGYITSSAAPIGALGDLLAATVNPNVGAWVLSPMASEVEAQTVRWIAEMIGFPSTCGGLMVSGGNMANFVCFLAARKAKANWDVRTEGMTGKERRLLIYTSSETHTWLQKSADMFGLGTNSIRWIPTDERLRISTTALRKQIQQDTEKGELPFLVVGTAGSVSTGAVDPLPELSAICREHNLWFHVDGAYGGLAALLPDAPPDLRGLSEADSVAVDPHKWLYAPLEAGCALVRDPNVLRDAFSYHPPYYRFDENADEAAVNYYEYGPQNSRGFRTLKVWLGLRQAGREGYVRMLSDDIQLAKELHQRVAAHPELEACTQGLSITTFRYVPPDLKQRMDNVEVYLNRLNTELLTRLQNSGEAYPSNAIIQGKFVMRVCIVNFRTSLEDIEALPEIVVRIGREVDAAMRPEELKDTIATKQ